MCSIDLVCEPAFGCFLSPLTWRWSSVAHQQPEAGMKMQDRTCLYSAGCHMQTAEDSAGHASAGQEQHDQESSHYCMAACTCSLSSCCEPALDATGLHCMLATTLVGSDTARSFRGDALARITVVQELAEALEQLTQ